MPLAGSRVQVWSSRAAGPLAASCAHATGSDSAEAEAPGAVGDGETVAVGAAALEADSEADGVAAGGEAHAARIAIAIRHARPE